MENESASSFAPEALQLNFEETRVFGCLLEKERTTPEYYPLTLNSLSAACNQKTSRHPITEFDDAIVEEALDGLRQKHLVMRVTMSGARTYKYKHTIEQVLPDLDSGARAVLCVLLLRGHQTLGEIKSRTERLHYFAQLEHARSALDALIEHDPPLAIEIPSGMGRRTATFAHLLSGPVDIHSIGTEATLVPASANSGGWRESVEQQIAELQAEVANLKADLEQLRNDLS